MPFLNSEAKLKQHQRVEIVQKEKEPVDIFRSFNRHARECNKCNKPLEVVRRGESLCDTGHYLAYDIAEVLYEMAGKKADQYMGTTGWAGILLDLTQFDGPVLDLVKAMDKGLRKRKPASTQVPVFSGTLRKPVSGHTSAHEHDHAHKHHHHHHHHDHRYSSSSAATHEYTQAPRVHHSRPEPERSPRASGSLRLHVPITDAPEADYGRDSAYYEEVYHPNGGRVTTKYYHPTTPKLIRANTIEAAPRTARKSTVRFDSEVKYYT